MRDRQELEFGLAQDLRVPQTFADWLNWAAWQDDVTFEFIEERTGMGEGEVVKWMRKTLTPRLFSRWRKRVKTQGKKHQAKRDAKDRARRPASRLEW